MFGREEKLKRQRAEKELSNALDEIKHLKKDIVDIKKQNDANLQKNSHLDEIRNKYQNENSELKREIKSLKKKYVENEEAKAVVCSLKVIKSVLFDERKVKDTEAPMTNDESYSLQMAGLMAAQQASQQFQSSGISSRSGFRGLS